MAAAEMAVPFIFHLSPFNGNCFNSIIFFIVLFQLQDVQLKAEKIDLCSGPLGMESGDISNSALSSSSFYVSNVGPQQARLNRDSQGGAWCPKEPIAPGVLEWLQITLNGTHLLSGVQLQGRYNNGRGQEYAEEFQLEYWREGFTSWRKYYRFDGKTVFPGNSDTNTVVTAKLRPPLFAEMVRVVPYSTHRRTVCLRAELLGCPFQDGVVQYYMKQGDAFSEGISLKDESYDGVEGCKWDQSRINTSVKAEQSISSEMLLVENYVNARSDLTDEINPSGESESANEEISVDRDIDGEMKMTDTTVLSTTKSIDPIVHNREKLSGGLGQLTDKIDGANTFAMDIGYGMGNGWVGWKRIPGDNEWIEVTFEFDTVRVFSHVDIFSSNSPSKHVQFVSKCRVYFSNAGKYYNSQSLVNHIPKIPTTQLSHEQIANLTVPLENRMGKFLKFQLFFRSSWIVLGEFYFHSQVFEGNWTAEEEVGSPDLDFLEDDTHHEIGDLNSSMVRTVVGTLSVLILIAAMVTAAVVWMRTKGSSLSSVFKSSSPTGINFSFPWRHSWNSVPTHIVTQNPAGGPQVMKDLVLSLNPRDANKISNPERVYAQVSNTVGGNDNYGGGSNSRRDNYDQQISGNVQCAPPSYEQVTGVQFGYGSVAFLHNNYGTSTKGKPSDTLNFKKYLPPTNQGTESLSTSSGCFSNNVSTTGSNTTDNHASPTQITLRYNQLAAMINRGEDDEWIDEDNSRLPELADTCTTRNSLSSTSPIHRQSSSTSRGRKSKVAKSSWNLSIEGNGRPIRNPRGTCISDVSLQQMRLVENLGSCSFGQVHMYDFEGEVESEDGTLYSNCRFIAKTIRSLSEIRLLNVLNHEHLAHMVCICTELKRPILALYPTPECGDLYSFLTHLPNTPSLSWLLRAGSQIASGMSYLESLHLVHRDLAARNCLVERNGTIRISDLAMSCEQYRHDYCHFDDKGFVPLRWWSYESIISGDFTIQSSVWSFGVTLWEILTLCRQRPLSQVADHQLRTLAETYRESRKVNQIWLPKPQLSPPEIFELMIECWKREPAERPTFQHINLFLEQKCSGSSTQTHPV